MSSPTPLQGLDLIDCAKANSKAGIEVAAEQCGYGKDIATFELELQKASSNIGVKVENFSDLVALDTPPSSQPAIEIAPETPDKL
ncbi:MAG: hypothetical protein KME17_27780 [Cyanosarcina radialis HA8281-LM2]|jgi:hypothetical protein|nr:hypothetical protein [Cyanosarcina radialis HA8281-LM2]